MIEENIPGSVTLDVASVARDEFPSTSTAKSLHEEIESSENAANRNSAAHGISSTKKKVRMLITYYHHHYHYYYCKEQ